MDDAHAIYSALQFPMVLILYAMAVLILLRARNVLAGDVTVPSAALLGCMSAFFFVWGVRLTFWHLRWTLKALDLDAASERMVNGVLVPAVCNIVGICLGAAVIVIASRPTLGRLAVPVVSAFIFAAITVGGALSGALRW